MATDFTHPFVRGANLYLTPRLMMAYEEWRRDVCALETKRVERDLGALRQACEAIANAKDWREFGSASQAVVSDYQRSTTSLWQEGFEVAIRHQSAFSEAFSHAMKSWHSTWTGRFEKAAAINPAAMPPLAQKLGHADGIDTAGDCARRRVADPVGHPFARREPPGSLSVAVEDGRVEPTALLRRLGRVRPRKCPVNQVLPGASRSVDVCQRTGALRAYSFTVDARFLR